MPTLSQRTQVLRDAQQARLNKSGRMLNLEAPPVIEPVKVTPKNNSTTSPIFSGGINPVSSRNKTLPISATAENPIVPVVGTEGTTGFVEDPGKELLLEKIKFGYKPTNEELSGLQDYFASKSYESRKNKKSPYEEQEAYFKELIKNREAEATRLESERKAFEENLLQSKQTKLQDYTSYLDKVYAPQYDSVLKAGEERTNQAKLGYAFQGFSRSTKAAEAVDSVQRDVAAARAAVDAARATELAKYEAIVSGATEAQIADFDAQIRAARDAAEEARISANDKLAELKLKTSQVGESVGADILAELQSSLDEDLQADPDLSKSVGYLISKTGEEILDADGKRISTEGKTKQEILNLGKEGGAYLVNPYTGESKQIVNGIPSAPRVSGPDSKDLSNIQYYTSLIEQANNYDLWSDIGISPQDAIDALSTSGSGNKLSPRAQSIAYAIESAVTPYLEGDIEYEEASVYAKSLIDAGANPKSVKNVLLSKFKKIDPTEVNDIVKTVSPPRKLLQKAVKSGGNFFAPLLNN